MLVYKRWDSVGKLFLFLFFSIYAFSADLHYSLYKKGADDNGSTLLIIGGIHGNEPGGYFAPMVFQQHYNIEKGNVWVVPNLNFDSIVRNRRGIYGDMNRKFAHINSTDRDFQIVTGIKKTITDPKVDLVLNLHDGHGFYRKKYVDHMFNPGAWGQAFIIDQKNIPGVKFGNLHEIAEKIGAETNIQLREDVHEFNIRNTKTKEKSQAMQQSLTYFAVTHNKPAFAIETSKNITELALKVYYQLQNIEKVMNIMGIEYSKDFALEPDEIRELLSDYGTITFPNEKITLDLSNLRKRINFFPIHSKALEYVSDNPLVAIVKEKEYLKIMCGNQLVSTIAYDEYNVDGSLSEVDAEIDGIRQKIKVGSIVPVRKTFNILPIDGYRVNTIGYVNKERDDESNVTITANDIHRRFSIDQDAKTYRVEFYNEDKFCGMVQVKFEDEEQNIVSASGALDSQTPL